MASAEDGDEAGGHPTGDAEQPPAPPSDSSSGSPSGWAGAVLRWLPPLVCIVVIVGAVSLVLDDGPPPTNDAAEAAAAPDTPVLSLRRWPGPIARAAADQRLEDRLAEFVATQPEDTCLSVRAEGVAFDHRADDPQVPASVQKLLTAVAVLSELPGDRSFVTEVRSPAPDPQGVVVGNLHLVGGGDPLLATEPYMARERNQPQVFTRLEGLADEIVAAGVTQVVGSVVGDEGRYDSVRYEPGWPSRFVSQGVVGPVSALSVNDGFAYFPDGGDLFFAADDPAQYAAAALQRLLEERGVAFLAEPASGPAPDDPVLASIESPALTEVVGQMLAESDNNTAEMLLKELGVQRRGEGSFDAGRAAIAEILDEEGLAEDDLVVADGSGLAPDDRLTCDLVLDVLQHDPTETDVRAGLAVSGETGTLSRRWLDTDLVGKVRAKTGTLNQVTGLAGEAETRAGDPATFALVVNLPDGEFIDGELIADQQELAEILVAHPDVPDLADVAP